MERQPEHWLYRLTAPEWLAAADGELVRARRALSLGDTRKGLFEARRAAGMAWNAVLCVAFEARYGRSYMEHLATLARDDTVPGDVRRAAAQLIARAPAPGEMLVRLPGTASVEGLAPAESAAAILGYARERVEAATITPPVH